MADRPTDVGAWELVYHAQRYLSTVAIAIAVFVPQLALLALLLGTRVRVGPYWAVFLFLAISDFVTILESGIALNESYFAHATESWLGRHYQGTGIGVGRYLPPPKGVERPLLVRKFDWWDRWLLTVTGDKSWAALFVAIVVVVLSTSVYIGWLWMNP
jgi:hypothetical protein